MNSWGVPARAPGHSESLGIFSKDFVVTFVATVLFLGSSFLLVPTLPLYVERLGASDSLIGLAMSAFSASAVLVRPEVGEQIELRGSTRIMATGAAIFMLGCLVYNWADSVWAVLAIRFVQGVGLAAFMTSTRTLIAEVAPRGRAGEALGFYHASRDLAFSFVPALGLALVDRTGFTVLFIISSAAAGSALVLAYGLRDRPYQVRPAQESRVWINRDAVFPALIMLTVGFSYGPVFTFLPVYADRGGVTNPGLFFTVYALTGLGARLVGGRLADRLGGVWAVAPGLLMAAIGLVFLAHSSDTFSTVISAVLYGLGFAAAFIGLMAYTVDRAGARGSAMATFTAAYPLGIGLGEIVMGSVLEFTTFRVMNILSALVVLGGLAGFVLYHRRTGR